MTLRSKLGMLFLAFLLLVAIAVAATTWTVRDQKQDALVINLAGRQRMLVQQITAQALHISLSADSAAHKQALRDAETVFDQTLHALIVGGETRYLPGQMVRVPAARSDAIQTRLNSLQDQWTAFRAHLRVIETAAPGSVEFYAAIGAVQTLAPPLVAQADDIVRRYEAESERKLARLQWIQAGFFLCAVTLLVAGVVIVRRDIIAPLFTLRAAAGQIGRGDLGSPVALHAPPELAGLAESFDTMRAQLQALTGALESRVNQRTRELTALYDVIREISSHLDIAHVLDSVTSKARDLLDSDVAFLCLLDDSGESLALKSYDGPQAAVCSTCVLAKYSVAQQILGHHEALICDVGGCQNIAPDYRASHLAAPLRVGERVIGALCVGSTRPATYSQEQVRLLTELVNSSAIALENARLYAQAERAATLEERQRIAADMHDGLAQTLGYVKLKAEHLACLIAQGPPTDAAHELTLISTAIERASHDVRQSIASLRAAPTPDRALEDQLVAFVASFTEPFGDVAVDVVTEGDVDIVLEDGALTQVLRVVQEALQNAHRHAHARHIMVCLERHAVHYRVSVRDDGCGFDIAGVNGTGHFGLSIMQARAARLDGTLTIESAPGHGTAVILTWPAAHPITV